MNYFHVSSVHYCLFSECIFIDLIVNVSSMNMFLFLKKPFDLFNVFFIYLQCQLNQSSGEISNFSLVTYAGLLQSFHLLKLHPFPMVD